MFDPPKQKRLSCIIYFFTESLTSNLSGLAKAAVLIPSLLSTVINKVDTNKILMIMIMIIVAMCSKQSPQSVAYSVE